MKVLIGIGVIGIIFASCSSGKHTASIVNSPTSNNSDTSYKLSHFNGDTTAYLNNLVRNKARYIGRPLSFFLKELELPISSFSAGSTEKRSDNAGVALRTDDFQTYLNKGDRKNNPAYDIHVDWQSMQPMDSIRRIYNENGNDKYKWSKHAENYFGKQIVGNIALPYYLH